MRNKKISLILVIVVAAIIIISVSACSLFGGTSQTVTVQPGEDASAGNYVAANCIPAVLQVYSSSASGSSSACGFFVTDDGYAITNAHVVDGNANANVNVEDINGNVHSAKVVFISESIDIAVLKVDVVAKQSYITFASSSDSDNLYCGDTVYFIGNPANMGILINSGIVSSVNTRVKSTSFDSTIPSIILDANINHGNSGGPVLNKNGYAVGVIYARMESTSASSSQSEDIYGLGCAVPSDPVVGVLETLGVTYTMV